MAGQSFMEIYIYAENESAAAWGAIFVVVLSIVLSIIIF